ncbi:MAG: hypothetical protein Q8P15_01070 [Nanoarchaeota archaeon]|nr:hypothetical protein [Nanoarchaeota archaeon]
MSYSDNLRHGEKMYIIPYGCSNVKDVISVEPQTGLFTRLTIYFPGDKYQVISNSLLKERGISLKTYIEQTEGWRPKNGN